MKTMTRSLLAALAASSVLVAGSANAATINVGDSLIPTGLVAGDSFQIAMIVQQNGTAGSSSDLNTISAFVTAQANASGSLVQSIGASWLVIGSGVEDQTAYDLDPSGVGLTNAIDYAPVTGPVYDVNGVKIADSETDLWDGTLDAVLTATVTGGTWTGVVHTSTLADGTVNSTNRTLGVSSGDDGRINRGISGVTTSGWINNGSETDRNTGRAFYALSETITVVPEPGSLALLGLGGLLIGARRRRG